MTDSDFPTRCRDCGLELPPHIPGGLCPNCLLGLGLAIPSDGEDAPETVRPSPPMRILGGYELVEEIGRGGMGVVWKARHLGLNRCVALKTLHASSLISPAARLRFGIEVEAVARLNHPNIVSLLEAGESDGLLFYTMNLVTGGTLADRLADRSRRPSIRSLVLLLLRVAHATQYAHQRGILHRDLKPSNILLDLRDEPLIADFSVARSLLIDSELTQTGTVVGSPHYMAPEQARADPRQLSTAADIYSLGAILYEMIAGRPPFVAATPLEVLDLARNAEPTPPGSAAHAESPLSRPESRDLDTIALKCLNKDPAARYASARDLAGELERWLAGRPIEGRRISPLERSVRWCRREPALAAALGTAAVLLATVAAGALLHGWRMDQATRRISAQAARLRDQNATLRLREAETLFARDDASKAVSILAALVRADPENTVASGRLISALRLRSFPRPRFYPFQHPANLLAVHWRADGRQVVSVSDDGIVRQWDAVEGRAAAVDLPLGRGPAEVEFAGDARVVVVARDRAVEWWSIAERRLVHQVTLAGRVTRLRLSADSQYLASADDSGRARIWLAASGTALADGVEAGDALVDVQFVGLRTNRLATVSRSGSVEAWDIATGNVLWSHASSTAGRTLLAASPDGSLLAVAEGPSVLVLDSATGREDQPPLRQPADVGLLKFSPDGTVLATTSSGPAGHQVRIDFLRVPGRAPILLPHRQEVRDLGFDSRGRRFVTASSDSTARVWAVQTGHPVSEPLQHSRGVVLARFGPDDRSIVTACFGGTLWLWRLPEPARRITFALGEPVISAAFDPSGDRVAIGGIQGAVGVWHRSTQGWQRIEAARHQGQVWHVEFSPDGRWLASAGADGTAHVWNVVTGEGRLLRHDNWSWVMRARFDRTGARVVTAGHDRQAIIWSVASGRPLTVLNHSNAVNDAVFSPDGRYVLTRSEDDRARLWDATAGRLLSDAMIHMSWVDAVLFDPQGRRALSASRDLTLRIWDIPAFLAGRPTAIREQWMPAGILDAVFSADGASLATVLEDQTVRLWHWHPFEAGPVLQHERTVFQAAFDPTGTRVVTSAGAEGARIWDVRSGRPTSEFLRQRGMTFVARFTPDGNAVFTAGEDGTAELWPAPPPRPAPPWLADLAETQAALREDPAAGFTQIGVMIWDLFLNKWKGRGGFDPAAWENVVPSIAETERHQPPRTPSASDAPLPTEGSGGE